MMVLLLWTCHTQSTAVFDWQITGRKYICCPEFHAIMNSPGDNNWVGAAGTSCAGTPLAPNRK